MHKTPVTLESFVNTALSIPLAIWLEFYQKIDDEYATITSNQLMRFLADRGYKVKTKFIDEAFFVFPIDAIDVLISCNQMSRSDKQRELNRLHDIQETLKSIHAKLENDGFFVAGTTSHERQAITD
jgi:hypothetical protein